jgi:hypothetical protein
MTTSFNLALDAATADDLAAKTEAMAAGLKATMPLTAARLAELCRLGERMSEAGLRKSDAERDIQDQTIVMPGPIDLSLPS